MEKVIFMIQWQIWLMLETTWTTWGMELDLWRVINSLMLLLNTSMMVNGSMIEEKDMANWSQNTLNIQEVFIKTSITDMVFTVIKKEQFIVEIGNEVLNMVQVKSLIKTVTYLQVISSKTNKMGTVKWAIQMELFSMAFILTDDETGREGFILIRISLRSFLVNGKMMCREEGKELMWQLTGTQSKGFGLKEELWWIKSKNQNTHQKIQFKQLHGMIFQTNSKKNF